MSYYLGFVSLGDYLQYQRSIHALKHLHYYVFDLSGVCDFHRICWSMDLPVVSFLGLLSLSFLKLANNPLVCSHTIVVLLLNALFFLPAP